MPTPQVQASPATATKTPPSATRIPALAPGESLNAVTYSSGRPLDRSLSAQFGAQLHTDLSDVRIHTGEHAAQAADAIQAQAFTVGKDIVFGAGQYQPESSSGKHLLAHELAHVAQPQGGAAKGISQHGDASEHEADHAADALMQGKTATPKASAAATVQCQPLPDADKKKESARSLTDRLLDSASPFLAASVGSATLNDFDTGKSTLKPAHVTELKKTAAHITQLLKQYPQSEVKVIGHTDTVGTEANNLVLGEARATAAAEELEKLGVPANIVSTSSAGESAPQAVKTKDETPNAQNRRVEVRFEPKAAPTISTVPKLEPKTTTKEHDDDSKAPAKPIDLWHVPAEKEHTGVPYRHDDSNPDWYKPIPPVPKGSGPKSALDVLGEKVIDPFVDWVAKKQSKATRDKIKQWARDGVAAGSAKAARALAQAAGETDPQVLDAVEKATEAALREKGQQPQ
ncbi:DUF4157 domain-containing protein [Rhodanobacter sp. C05]|uniref:eCIS core domain-containing protein n=1 Tax=Rhodanobacter sp. C05 TaxID=1945855 RepID=UPI001C2CBA2A|nr:DUF4157 domain-containing protein [Rhodanobacter sp. C05]